MFFEYLQGQWLPLLLGLPVPESDHILGEEFFPSAWPESPWCNLRFPFTYRLLFPICVPGLLSRTSWRTSSRTSIDCIFFFFFFLPIMFWFFLNINPSGWNYISRNPAKYYLRFSHHSRTIISYIFTNRWLNSNTFDTQKPYVNVQVF